MFATFSILTFKVLFGLLGFSSETPESLYPQINTSVMFSVLDQNEARTVAYEDVLCMPCRMRDSLALLQFYLSAQEDGPWIIPWDYENEPMDNWWGIRLDANGCVQSFRTRDENGDPFNNNIEGEIPPSFGDLMDLDTLEIFSAGFDTIPNAIGNLLDLEFFALAAVTFQNSKLPSSIGNLSELTILNLNSILGLTGPIPPEIGNLTNLERLRLRADFTGEIPVEITTLSNLKVLDIFGNTNLTGTIPPQIGNMTSLGNLTIRNNGITGSIPAELGNLPSLNLLFLYGNQLSGPIPPALANATNIDELRLDDNALTGEIPISIWQQLTKMNNFNLANNDLSGQIPSEISNMSELRRLNLTGNNFAGPLPVELGILDSLIEIQLAQNSFTGAIPPMMGNLSKLALLELQDNNLSGCFPSDLLNLCDPSITVDFSNNPGLPNEGDFDLFCIGENGLCSENFECPDAIELPINREPCDRDSRLVYLANATTSAVAPFGVCDTSYAGNDVWFKATVPSTGNLLIRRDSATDVRLFAEAYSAACPATADDTVGCAYLSEPPYVLVLENQTPGSEVYIRLWDSLNVAVNETGIGLSEISAHRLSADPAEWQLCDFIAPPDNSEPGTGQRQANEFIVQFEEGTTAQEVVAERVAAGVTSFETCDCANTPLELWKSLNPIDTEVKRKKVANSGSGNQDTTNYNYELQIVPLLDTLRNMPAFNLINSPSPRSSVAMNEQGNYIVVGVDVNSNIGPGIKEIYARQFNKEGRPSGAEFLIDPVATSPQAFPGIDLNENNEFIVVWTDINIYVDNNNNATLTSPLYRKRFDKNGNLISQDSIDNAIRNPVVSLLDDGSHILVYDDESIVWKKYASDGLLVQSGNIDGFISNPNVFLRENGDFVIVWTSYIEEPSDGIYKRSYNADGTPKGPIIQVNVTSLESESEPQIDRNQNGDYVITWNSGENLFARRYDNQDNPIGSEFLVVNTSSLGGSDVSMDKDGDFAIVWARNQDEIFVKYYNRNGNPIGNTLQFIADEPNVGNPSIALNSAGNIIITWSLFSNIIIKRLFSPGENIPITDVLVLADTIGTQKAPYTPYTPQNTIGGITTAIMDSGIEKDDPNFQNVLWSPDFSRIICTPNQAPGDVGYDYINNDGDPDDLDGHGHAVNGQLINGFPSDLQLDLLNVKFYENGKSDLFKAVCGMYYAIEQGAKVLNLSWGFESGEFPAILQRAIDYAACQDVLIVTSAGNEGKNNDLLSKYPATLSTTNDNVITVGAYDEAEGTGIRSIAEYSNRGQSVDLVAPGFVETLDLEGNVTSLVGTSLSTPAVARVAAIIRARYPHLTAQQVKDCLLSSADPGIPEINSNGGILNEANALACAENAPVVGITTDCYDETTVKIKAFLQGPFNGSDMNNNLTLPKTDPYDGVIRVNTIPADAVDWVKVEIRDPADPSQLLEGKYRIGFLRKDGQVLDRLGNVGVKFRGLKGKQGHIVIRHRNHLGVMTENPANF